MVLVGNIEHRTSNIEHPMKGLREEHWMLDVGCWLLDVHQVRRGGGASLPAG
jgi:hypothetical protein